MSDDTHRIHIDESRTLDQLLKPYQDFVFSLDGHGFSIFKPDQAFTFGAATRDEPLECILDILASHSITLRVNQIKSCQEVSRTPPNSPSDSDDDMDDEPVQQCTTSGSPPDQQSRYLLPPRSRNNRRRWQRQEWQQQQWRKLSGRLMYLQAERRHLESLNRDLDPLRAAEPPAGNRVTCTRNAPEGLILASANELLSRPEETEMPEAGQERDLSPSSSLRMDWWNAYPA